MQHHLTSTLNDAWNDTGRDAYCGPTVVSAITGWRVSKVEEAIYKHRNTAEQAQRIIRGTTIDEVCAALDVFGYEAELSEDYEHLTRKERPTLWTWMQKPRNAWAHYLLAIAKGKQGHWVCVKGTKLCDTFTGGQWEFVADGPHKGAKISQVHIVRKIPSDIDALAAVRAHYQREHSLKTRLLGINAA